MLAAELFSRATTSRTTWLPIASVLITLLVSCINVRTSPMGTWPGGSMASKMSSGTCSQVQPAASACACNARAVVDLPLHGAPFTTMTGPI